MSAEGDRDYKEGEALLSSASKKGFFWSGNSVEKYEDAAEKFKDAGAAYRTASAMDQAGAAYTRAANIYKDNLEAQDFNAAAALREAAKCYRVGHLGKSIIALENAVNISDKKNRRRAAEDITSDSLGLARLQERASQEAKTEEEQTKYMQKAIESWRRASKIYEGEGTSFSLNKARDNIGRLEAQRGEFGKAYEEFKENLKSTINDATKKHFRLPYMLNSGLCILAKNEYNEVQLVFKEYGLIEPFQAEEVEYTDFIISQEGKFLLTLRAAIDAADLPAVDVALKSTPLSFEPFQYRLFEQIKKNANKGNLNMKYADDNAAEEDDEYA